MYSYLWRTGFDFLVLSWPSDVWGLSTNLPFHLYQLASLTLKRNGLKAMSFNVMLKTVICRLIHKKCMCFGRSKVYHIVKTQTDDLLNVLFISRVSADHAGLSQPRGHWKVNISGRHKPLSHFPRKISWTAPKKKVTPSVKTKFQQMPWICSFSLSAPLKETFKIWSIDCLRPLLVHFWKKFNRSLYKTILINTYSLFLGN